MKIKNLYRRNKYFLCEYELDINNPQIVSLLWQHKENLKYIDSKTYPDKCIISIADSQIAGFIELCDKLNIGYSKQDLLNLDYNNKSNHKLCDYSLSKNQPYDFQIEDAKKLLTWKRGLLGSTMGCGKTLVAIMVGESIKSPKLVVCPESLRLNWKHEILDFNPNSIVEILKSDEEFHTGKDWTICGYKTAVKFEKELLKFDCIFLDECHFIKAVNNWGKPNSKRAKAIMNLAENTTYCYLISGTPLPSKNLDLYNILKILKAKEIMSQSFFSYGKKYCDAKQTKFGVDYSGNSNSEELHKILSNVMVRRLREDVLPDLKKQRKFIPIWGKFGRDYIEIEEDLFNGGSYLGCSMSGRRVLSKYKIPTCIDLIDEFLDEGESVVVVSEFIDTIKMLNDHYKDKCCIIQGGMSDKAKQQSVEDFQSGKKKICLVNMIAGGVGITLTAAHKMIMIDYDWIPGNNAQAEDRICRVGQNELCQIYYLYFENSVFDEAFISMISRKSSNIDLVVDNADNSMDLNQTYLDSLKEQIANKSN